jgi:hypothetical protein
MATAKLPDPTYLENPGYNLPSRDQQYTIACRLIHQTEGTIAGISPDGQRTGKSYHRGTLSLEEAIFAVQFSLSRGLNPFADIHIWWYKKLVVSEHYKIMAGWARLREPYTDRCRPLPHDEKMTRSLAADDLAVRCYILKNANQPMFIECIRAQMDPWQALDIAATSAVGIVYADEMTDKEGKFKRIDVRGWDWQQRAEIRAFRSAISRSHGTPTPAEIQAYARQLNPNMTADALADPRLNPADLPPDAQNRFFALSQPNRPDSLSLEERVTLLRGEEEDGID